MMTAGRLPSHNTLFLLFILTYTHNPGYDVNTLSDRLGMNHINPFLSIAPRNCANTARSSWQRYSSNYAPICLLLGLLTLMETRKYRNDVDMLLRCETFLVLNFFCNVFFFKVYVPVFNLSQRNNYLLQLFPPQKCKCSIHGYGFFSMRNSHILTQDN